MKNTKLWMASILCTLLLALSVFSPGANAAEHPTPQGHKHVDVDIYKVPGDKTGKKKQGKTYPSVMDPRNEEWYKTNIQVRDQADLQLCWAFSVCTAAQISYARERYLETGDVFKVGLLSPVQLGYFFYNREDDPLRNTGGDKNLCHYDDNDWTMEGNSCVYTMQHLATWSGLAQEPQGDGELSFKTRINEEGKTEYCGNMTIDKKYAYEHVLVEEESTYYDQGDVDTVKGVVNEYGAAVVSLFFGNSSKGYPLDNFLMEDRYFYNNKYFSDNNHEVVIVGWDDTIPRSRFQCKERGSGKIVHPERDGAWIVMNSWGKNNHDHGYFYVSYDSVDILSDGILGLNMKPADDRISNYQYDGNANNGEFLFYEGEKAANVFTVPSDTDIALESISFTEYNDGLVNYDLNIYTGLLDASDPESGHKIASQKITTTTPGYKTIPLQKPVSIARGATYAVVITLNSQCILGGELAEERNFEAELKEGQSFYYSDEKGVPEWIDASEKGIEFCLRIKAQTTSHTWEAPVYHWSADNRQVTATRVCADDAAYTDTETVETTSTVTRAATYTQAGQTTYTAEFANPIFAKQSKTLDNIPKLAKKAGTLTVNKPKTKTVSYNKLKKKSITLSMISVKKSHGKVTYKVIGGNTKSKKTLKCTSKGKISVKKKSRKGTYKIKVKVSDAGNAEYNPSSKTVITAVKVK